MSPDAQTFSGAVHLHPGAARRDRCREAIGTKRMRVTIFDFDGTLFRSPERPTWWPLAGFWSRLESLGPPFVPEDPGHDWWAADVVAEARKAIADPESMTVLLTGRSERFAPRVTELLHGHRFWFDESHFMSLGETETLGGKLRVIEALARRTPRFEVVEVWDDRHEHLAAFETRLQALDIKYIGHHVRRATRGPATDADGLAHALKALSSEEGG